VAVLVFYASETNNRGGWFNLTWEGNTFDPLRTKHVASFSSASSGVIRYPAIGQYETSLAATWVINTDTTQETTRSDLNLETLNLQSCPNPDPCTCDALLIFQISEQGMLHETEWFCRDSTNMYVPALGSRFVLAFFTDFQTQSSDGSGFQAIYFPTMITTTYYTTDATTSPTSSTTPRYVLTTETVPTAVPSVSTDSSSPTSTGTPRPRTTRYKTSTEYGSTGPPEGTIILLLNWILFLVDLRFKTINLPFIATHCGEVFNTTTGYISHKYGMNYDPNERCVWTIQVHNATSYRFVIYGLENIKDYDGISISTLSRHENPIQDLLVM
jgi:hypothetical protein